MPRNVQTLYPQRETVREYFRSKQTILWEWVFWGKMALWTKEKAFEKLSLGKRSNAKSKVKWAFNLHWTQSSQRINWRTKKKQRGLWWFIVSCQLLLFNGKVSSNSRVGKDRVGTSYKSFSESKNILRQNLTNRYHSRKSWRLLFSRWSCCSIVAPRPHFRSVFVRRNQRVKVLQCQNPVSRKMERSHCGWLLPLFEWETSLQQIL